MARQHGRDWRNVLENKVRQSKIFKLYCVSCICLNLIESTERRLRYWSDRREVFYQ